MAADVIVAAEVVKTALVASFAAGTPVVATIDRVYREEFQLEDFDDLRVDIWHFPYKDAGDITRSEFDEEMNLYVVVAKRWTEPSVPTKAWIDGLVDLVHDRVFLTIKGIPNVEGLRKVGLEVTTVCDHQTLREFKVFWSEVRVVFRKIETY